MKKWIYLLLMVSVGAYANDEKKPGPSPASSSIPFTCDPTIKSYIPTGSDGFPPQTSPAIVFMKSYVKPSVDSILSRTPGCKRLTDDVEALNLLKSLYAREEKTNAVLKVRLPKVRWRVYYTEAQAREAMEQLDGHITFDHTNKTTIDALINVWQKFPCSEAGVISLLEVWRLVASPPGELDVTYQDGDLQLALINETNSVAVYIMNNYPNTWQAEFSRLRYYIHNDDEYSEETLDAYLDWIDCVEDNDILKNENFKFYFGRFHSDLEKDFISQDYGAVSEIYFHRCEEAEKKGIKETGTIPPEALENYYKHIQLQKRIRILHPNVIEFNPADERSACEYLIKKYAPEYYIEEPLY